VSEKQLALFILKVTQSDEIHFAKNKSGLLLVQLGYANEDGQRITVNPAQRSALKIYLKTRFDIDWTVPIEKLSSGSRLDVAAYTNREKFSQKKVKETWLKLKPLTTGCKLNHNDLPVMNAGHIEISQDDVASIDIDCLLMVENADVFNRLQEVILSSSLPDKTLAVYRGDPQSAMTISWVKSIGEGRCEIACYADYDPAGMVIAHSLHIDAILLPTISELDTINGDKEAFDDQSHQLESLITNNKDFALTLQAWFDYLLKRKMGFTQEVMIAKQVTHEWISIRK